MIADNAVIQAQVCADAGSYCLLTDVGVYYTRDSPTLVIYNYSFLKSPDSQHHLIQMDQFLSLVFHP
jgi:hypothetical protein